MTAGRSAGLVRRWVALYTAGLPADIRDARREEIEDDLWCQAHEVDPEVASDGVLGRLVFGLWADITWRLEQRHRARVRPVLRSATTGTRVVAAFSIIGGAALTVTLAIAMALVSSAPDGTFNTLDWRATDVTVMLMVFSGSVLLLSIALWGLIFRFNDRMGGNVALAGSVGGFGGMLMAMGAYQLLVVLPIGSAAVVWDLSRFGVLPRSVAIVHALAALAFFIILVAGLTRSLIGVTSPISALAVLIVLYPLTWIVIGAALLRGQPVAGPVARVEAPR